MIRSSWLAVASLGVLGGPAMAQSSDYLDFSKYQRRYVLEGGFLASSNLDLRGGPGQANSISGWDSVGPTARAEAWFIHPDRLKIGIIVQPLYAKASGTTSSDLNYRGTAIPAGQQGHLTYQFPSLRATANYDVWGRDDVEIRLGSSLVARYAGIKLTTPASSIKVDNLIAFPVANIELSAPLFGNVRALGSMDFFPASGGTGFYDAFLGVSMPLDAQYKLDVGLRSIWGGYLPDPGDDQVGTKISFQGLVVRLSF